MTRALIPCLAAPGFAWLAFAFPVRWHHTADLGILEANLGRLVLRHGQAPFKGGDMAGLSWS
jgi:hypothetical protein